MGFNKDAIFVSYNNFGSGGAAVTVVSIDKGALLGGTLSYFVSAPPSFQFRAMPPAQMHGDTTGGTEWFVSTDGNDAGGNTIRVTELTNYLSNHPTYQLWSLPVAQYEQATFADQPGGSWTTFPNTTTTQVQYRDGMLVTAMASATAADGFRYPKGLYYEVSVLGGMPSLQLQGVIDPGQGVAVQMPSVAIDAHGNLGFTWMEGSTNEYVSMWVGSLDTKGHFAAYDAAPGQGFFAENFRIGDYSSTVVDPTDGTTFWSANEYIGPNGSSDIWNTHIQSFSVPPAVNNDWYSIDVQAGTPYALYVQSYTPSDQGGQFINTAAPNIELYDTFGNLVATGTVLPDGRNEVIFYSAPITGQYFIRVFNNPGNSGEYYLQVDTPPYASGDIAGQVFNDPTGAGVNPGNAGLDNWEVDVFDAGGNFVASQMTHGGGNYDIGGLAPGTYKVEEVLKSGWTQTSPLPNFTWTVTVIAGGTATGNDFGNFQNVTISGEKFNDLTGAGFFVAGDPGLPGWTIDLLNPAGAIVATTTTDANGNYSFTNVGPGTYTVQEELKPGWIQTYPAPPGTYTVTTSSGQNVGGEDFGNFQLVTVTGTVYNDSNGNGADDGETGLQGWTVNLLDSKGNLVATTTSDVNGNYQFANLGPGTYEVQEVNQSGWYQTQPVNPPGTYTFQATSSTNPSGLNFGNFQLASVSGTVYNDANSSGHRDQGEPGLQGWTVLLLDTSFNQVASTVSDANGNYAFKNLFPGTFIVEEVLQANWTQTEPVNPSYYQFTTQSGVNAGPKKFGNYTPYEYVSGQVYNDLNGDGSNDGGTDPGLANWTVKLLDASKHVVATTTSDAGGNYSFGPLSPQVYTIQEVTQSGWIITQPTNPPGTYTLPAMGGVQNNLNFGNFQLVSVSGNVYNDLNGNGSQDQGEPGLKGWTVNVVNAGGKVVAHATTDASGNYTITGVGPGSFTLNEVTQTGWVITQPTNPNYYSFTTSSGVNVVGGIFGNFQTITVSGNVYNDQNGNGQKSGSEPGLQGWTVELRDSGNNLVATTTTDSSGNYTFSNVGAGSYSADQVVQTNWVHTIRTQSTIRSISPCRLWRIPSSLTRPRRLTWDRV
jgi:protocatechuate 3,4-dioxygenase beta subunit